VSLICFIHFQRGEANKNCIILIIKCNDPFLCIMSANTNLQYVKFVRHYLKVSHFLHVFNC
jgi:hypothetical protein